MSAHRFAAGGATRGSTRAYADGSRLPAVWPVTVRRWHRPTGPCNYTYRARAIHAPSTLEPLQGTGQCAASRSGARIPPLVLGHRGRRRAGDARSDAARRRRRSRRRYGVALRRRCATAISSRTSTESACAREPASLPHIAVAGAVSTATHGSGGPQRQPRDCRGRRADRDVRRQRLDPLAGDAAFEGVVVGLGSVGAVARVTLDLEPTYQIRQQVFERLRWEELFEHFDAITSSGYSVSVFTRWGETVDQVWVKSRVTEESEPERRESSAPPLQPRSCT